MSRDKEKSESIIQNAKKDAISKYSLNISKDIIMAYNKILSEVGENNENRNNNN